MLSLSHNPNMVYILCIVCNWHIRTELAQCMCLKMICHNYHKQKCIDKLVRGVLGIVS